MYVYSMNNKQPNFEITYLNITILFTSMKVSVHYAQINITLNDYATTINNSIKIIIII